MINQNQLKKDIEALKVIRDANWNNADIIDDLCVEITELEQSLNQ